MCNCHGVLNVPFITLNIQHKEMCGLIGQGLAHEKGALET